MTPSHDLAEPCDRFEWERMLRGLRFGTRRPAGQRVAVTGHSVKAIARAVATYADQDGTRVRPSVRAIAAQEETTVRTVRLSLAVLTETGCLLRQRDARPAQGRAAEYRLARPVNLATLLDLVPAPSDRGEPG